MASLTPLVDRLRALLGARGVDTDPQTIAAWSTDWRGRFQGTADAIVAPASTAEVAQVVRLAAEAGAALVPQGGNTSMVGGATPPSDRPALILSLRRLASIRRVSAAERLAVVEAGVVLQALHEALAADGLRFPLTLGARGSATIGGLVSTNAGGTQVLRWGTMRALVAGLEAVLPSGDVLDNLAALPKDNRGYDLTQLLIGAEGTLGVVTAATLRLAPAVRERAVGWGAVDDPQAALALLRALQAETSALESFEIIPADTLALAVAHLPGARAPLDSPSPWHVLVELVSTGEGDPPPQPLLERLLGQALERGQLRDAVVAASEAQADAFWRLRDSLSAAERSTGPAVQHDISVPVAAMPRFLTDAAAAVEARFAGTHATAFGHLGDGNLHFHVRAPAGVDARHWYAEDAPGITRFVHDLVEAAGGSISAEHGIGQMKADELARLASPARMQALRAIKQALDPAGIMNPGKLVGLAPAPPRP